MHIVREKWSEHGVNEGQGDDTHTSKRNEVAALDGCHPIPHYCLTGSEILGWESCEAKGIACAVVLIRSRRCYSVQLDVNNLGLVSELAARLKPLID